MGKVCAGLTSAVALVAAQPSHAQVGPGCTVSVLNRTVQVNPDGSWVLPNVPANFGPVRARATCVRNGITTSGESEPFTVPANGIVNFPKIQFGQLTPIPRSLTLSAPVTRLTAPGQSIQLAVTARYSDDSTKDVTAANNVTQYTVSNPAIARVSADGLITAVTSGTVLVQATHEGATGMAAIIVALATVDSDGDGMPDEYELANGMNPNDPIDAQEDFDRDGLTNLQEFQRGTDPRNPDADGDGLKDGDEVTRGTNPLLRDTDGDSVSDGLEVSTGSNPLDPASVNLAAALSNITVTPAIFTLTFNTIAGEVFQPLKVTGTLRDGAGIDLTSRQRGTNYSSSDLTVCNFGAGDGRVYAGQSGSCTITVAVGGISKIVSGTVFNFAPRPVGQLGLGGVGIGVAVSGNWVYVAMGSAGLRVVDMTHRTGPLLGALLPLPGSANSVRLAGTRAYVAAGSAGLHIVDVADPQAPRLLGTMDTPGTASDVRVRGDLAFVADGAAGLQVIDVRNQRRQASWVR